MNIVLPVCLYLDDNKEVNARMREELGKRLHKTEYDYTDYLKCLAKYFDYEVYRNYKKAACWLEKAAIQDDDWAQLLLGDCYYLGRGVAKNHKTADDILVSDKHGLKPYFFSSFLQEKVHFQALF